MERLLKSTKASSNEKKRKHFTQSQPISLTQRCVQPLPNLPHPTQQGHGTRKHFTKSQAINVTQRRVEPLPYQQPLAQAEHGTKKKHLILGQEMSYSNVKKSCGMTNGVGSLRRQDHNTMAEHPAYEVGQEMHATMVKNTRGITRGVGAHAVVSATKRRIPIVMDHNQKLPQSIKANAMFNSEIGAMTRKHAPVVVETWRKVSDTDKATIITALTIKFDFDKDDPHLLKHIEDHMGKSYRQWKCKLHKHFKLHAENLEYVRAHPPPVKLWGGGTRKMAEWEYLCDQVFSKEDYQERSQINSENRSKLKYNHCGGSRPFQKHMEAALEKGEDMTIVENWINMHQHHNGSGNWVNSEAEKIGNKMLAELEKEKQKLVEMQGISPNEVSVPLPKQLEILANGVGVMKGKTIRGLGYGRQKEVACTCAKTSNTLKYTPDELLDTIGKLAMQIDKLEAKFAAFAKVNMSFPDEDEDEDENEEDVQDGNGDYGQNKDVEDEDTDPMR